MKQTFYQNTWEAYRDLCRSPGRGVPIVDPVVLKQTHNQKSGGKTNDLCRFPGRGVPSFDPVVKESQHIIIKVLDILKTYADFLDVVCQCLTPVVKENN